MSVLRCSGSLLGLALGLVVAGCSPDRSQRGAVLHLDNDSGAHSVTVYSDDAELGTVRSDGGADLPIRPGTHTLEGRWGNSAMPRQPIGVYTFPPGQTVTVQASD